MIKSLMTDVLHCMSIKLSGEEQTSHGNICAFHRYGSNEVSVSSRGHSVQPDVMSGQPGLVSIVFVR